MFHYGWFFFASHLQIQTDVGLVSQLFHPHQVRQRHHPLVQEDLHCAHQDGDGVQDTHVEAAVVVHVGFKAGIGRNTGLGKKA